MRTLFILLLALNLNAQDGYLFLEFGIDPRMAVQGPYYGKPQDTNGGTYNAEYKFGIEWTSQRLGYAFETHSAIHYQKHSVFFDHKFNNKIGIVKAKNFTTYLGGELLWIRRTWPDASYDQPDNYRKITHSPAFIPLYGFNAGLYYSIFYKKRDTGFQLGINFNAFRGEGAFQKWKTGYFDEFRTDVMITIKRNF